MPGKLFPDCGCAPGVGIDLTDAGGRRRSWIVQQSVHDPEAAFDGGGGGSVGGEFVDCSLAEQPAPEALWREVDLADFDS